MKKIKLCYFIVFLLIIPFYISAQDMAYPIEGDGIRSFLRRWNRVDTTYIQEFINLNTGRLNSLGGLELGTVYLIPPLHQGDVYPPSEATFSPINSSIFGKKYAVMSMKSGRLKGACFYIISGHGGPDPGAISKMNGHELHENEYAYDIALRLARSLMMEGATVYLIIQDPSDGIRDDKYLNNNSDETCMGEPIPRGQIDRLRQRVDKVNSLYEKKRKHFLYSRAISIHVDSRSKKKRLDVFFYHAADKKSRATAYTIRDVFQQKYNKFQPGRGFQGIVEHRNLYVLRNLKPASILVEVGNIQNEFDRRRIILKNNRQAMANWIALGFMRDFQSKK